MSTGVNMSLDEIIQASRKNKRTGGMRSDGVRKVGGPRVGGRPRNFAFTEHVPEGKWKHDMFNKSDNGAPRLGGNMNKRVTLNVSNLDPHLIGSEDLEELFANFEVEDIVLHHDANGDRIGTAAVTCKKSVAAQIIEEYKNVKLDGRLLKLAIVDDEHGSGSIRNRLEFSTLSGRVTKPSQGLSRGGGFKKRGGPAGQNKPRKAFLDRIVDDDDEENKAGGRRGRGRVGREKQPEKTLEELDADLDAYMNLGKGMEM